MIEAISVAGSMASWAVIHSSTASKESVGPLFAKEERSSAVAAVSAALKRGAVNEVNDVDDGWPKTM